MEFKTLSYKNLRNMGLVMVFKCVMMIVLLSVVSLSASGQKNEKFEVNGVTFEMVYVPGGTFRMGATAEQGSDAYDWEKPTHSVTLSGYYIGKYEVTQALWKAIMGNNPSCFKGDDLPVENVSRTDCQVFIMKLNLLTGKKFSLPTEAQWEYAARGGKSGGTKYSGSDDIGNVAWCEINSSNKTHPVGTKSPNSLGIYDMSGNVWEWCQDWYRDYSSNSQTNPTGLIRMSGPVGRGGGWYNGARDCRVSNRIFTPVLRSSGLGFRLALSEQQDEESEAEVLNETENQSDPNLDKFEVNGVTFEMVYVPGGTFTMGATAEQGKDAYYWEKPTHSVTLSGYYIGKYEVTQAQWKAIMGNNPSGFKGDNLPVERVSWDDCQEFIIKLNELTGKKFSLPTEAQWEYAARGGKSVGTKYSGRDNIENVAWYLDNSGLKTHPVGTKSPNSLGIYDMTGNVWEWCQDWFDYDYYKNSPTTNPTGPNSGSNRVYRGGSWDSSARYCRVLNRSNFTPDDRSNSLGFRLCCP